MITIHVITHSTHGISWIGAEAKRHIVDLTFLFISRLLASTESDAHILVTFLSMSSALVVKITTYYTFCF